MKEKEKLLLLYLHSNVGYTQCHTLAKYLDLSERSVKRYVKKINDEPNYYGAQVEGIKGVGYRLQVINPKCFNKILKLGNNGGLKNTSRTMEILRSLLKFSSISMEELEESFYLSRSTLQIELGDIRKILDKYQVRLKYKPYRGLYISGEEENIRKCFVKSFFSKEQGKELELIEPLSNINESFIKGVKEYITQVVARKEIIKNEYEIIYLTKFIIVSCYRIQYEHFISDKTSGLEINEDLIIFAKDFKDYVLRKCKIELPEKELQYMNLLIQMNCEFTPYMQISSKVLKEVIKETLENIDDKHRVHLSKDEALIVSLTQHIKNAYHRYYWKLDVDNIVLDEIKMSYPEVFSYALELKVVIEQHFNVVINEKELGYIAIHFATAIERIRYMPRYKTLIISNTGAGTLELLKTKLNRYFPEIQVVGCFPISRLKKKDLNEVDFIISTTPIEMEEMLQIPIIYISHILSNVDMNQIEDELGKAYLKNYLCSLFREDLFYPKQTYSNKLELLKSITQDMVSKNYISDKDRDNILKREELASTEVSDLVAVPHVVSNTNKNVIGICTLKNPISWGSTKVKLVLIACLDAEVKDNRHIFPFIHERTKNAEVVNQLCECLNLEEWEEILLWSIKYDYRSGRR